MPKSRWPKMPLPPYAAVAAHCGAAVANTAADTPQWQHRSVHSEPRPPGPARSFGHATSRRRRGPAAPRRPALQLLARVTVGRVLPCRTAPRSPTERAGPFAAGARAAHTEINLILLHPPARGPAANPAGRADPCRPPAIPADSAAPSPPAQPCRLPGFPP